MVYVQDIDGKPMMPTTRHGKVRRLLKSKKATVVNLCPFTIRLLYDTTGYKQEITLGVDTGTKHVGLSDQYVNQIRIFSLNDKFHFFVI